MSLAGSLREIYETDAFPGGTICVVEAASVDEARVTYANRPMLKAGLLDAEVDSIFGYRIVSRGAGGFATAVVPGSIAAVAERH